MKKIFLLALAFFSINSYGMELVVAESPQESESKTTAQYPDLHTSNYPFVNTPMLDMAVLNNIKSCQPMLGKEELLEIDQINEAFNAINFVYNKGQDRTTRVNKYYYEVGDVFKRLYDAFGYRNLSKAQINVLIKDLGDKSKVELLFEDETVKQHASNNSEIQEKVLNQTRIRYFNFIKNRQIIKKGGPKQYKAQASMTPAESEFFELIDNDVRNDIKQEVIEDQPVYIKYPKISLLSVLTGCYFLGDKVKPIVNATFSYLKQTLMEYLKKGQQ